ncbi:MAG: DUF308 domain-containing protein [Clostridia bacterium]|nr:DUF308 domain-containing protein [Clostridia bacterium]
MSDNTKLKWTLVQTAWSLGGISLLAGAVMAMMTPNEELVSIANRLGYLMLFAGIINIFVYMQNKNPLMGAHWIIADGLSTAFLALFPLINGVSHSVLIPFFFGVWELFSGVIKIVECIELQDYKIKGWQWFAAIGSVELFSGISSMIKPVDDLIGIHVVVAIIMIIQSLGFVFKIVVFRHLMHKRKK